MLPWVSVRYSAGGMMVDTFGGLPIEATKRLEISTRIGSRHHDPASELDDRFLEVLGQNWDLSLLGGNTDTTSTDLHNRSHSALCCPEERFLFASSSA